MKSPSWMQALILTSSPVTMLRDGDREQITQSASTELDLVTKMS